MIGIFYGSSTGQTEELAQRIAKELGVESTDLHNVANSSAAEVEKYDKIVLGSSTWGLGELQDDWYDFLDQLKKLKLEGREVALFGCGDAASYPDTFCDALGIIKEGLAESGCTFVGALERSEYQIDDSRAVEGDKTVGLLCDEYEPEQTDKMLPKWIAAIGSK